MLTTADPRPVGTRKLILEILETSPCYLTTTQSEEGPQAGHAPHDPLPHTVFKNLCLKATGEFGCYEHELSILLAWPHVGRPAVNAAFSFHNLGSVDQLYCVWVGGREFGLVMRRGWC